MIAVYIVYWALLSVVLCGGLYLFILALAALLPAKRSPGGADNLPFLSILIPAHNEEALVLDLLESLDAQDYPRDRFRSTWSRTTAPTQQRKSRARTVLGSTREESISPG